MEFLSWSPLPPNLFTVLSLSGSACNLTYLTTLLYRYRYQHGQTSYFSSRHRSGYGFSIGFLQRVSKVKVLSFSVTLQITHLWYPRREQGLVAREVPIVRYGFAPSRLDPRGFVLDLDEEDPFVRDLEPFDDLEAREPVVRSVIFVYL